MIRLIYLFMLNRLDRPESRPAIEFHSIHPPTLTQNLYMLLDLFGNLLHSLYKIEQTHLNGKQEEMKKYREEEEKKQKKQSILSE